jgi:hypothetical protein
VCFLGESRGRKICDSKASYVTSLAVHGSIGLCFAFFKRVGCGGDFGEISVLTSWVRRRFSQRFPFARVECGGDFRGDFRLRELGVVEIFEVEIFGEISVLRRLRFFSSSSDFVQLIFLRRNPEHRKKMLTRFFAHQNHAR